MQDEKRRTLAENVISADREMLVVKYRYMVRALYALKAEPIENNSGINYGTDGLSFYYNINKLLRDYLSDDVDTSSIYLHGVIHCLYMHPFFADKYEHRDIWNLSCDIFAYYVMTALQKEIVSKERELVITELKDKVKVITAQSIYRYLSVHFMQGAIEADYLYKIALMFRVDDHDLWYSHNGEYHSVDANGESSKYKESAYAQWKEILDQTEVGLSSQHSIGDQDQGTQKGDLLESLAGIRRDYIDYSDFLRKFAVIEERMRIDMDSFDYNFYMYGLELYKDMPLIEPLEYKEEYTIREFVIAIDTSGSCDIGLIRKFLTVTYDILFESIIDDNSLEIHIIQCDADIQEDYVVKKKEDMIKYLQNLRIRGRGGTDFRPVFERIDHIREDGGLKGLRGLIYFTDGYGTFPTKPTDYKTAFAFAEMDKNINVPPWIMKTYIEKELI